MCRKDIAAAETACLDQVEFQRARTPVGSLSIRWPYHPMLRRKWQRGFAVSGMECLDAPISSRMVAS